jgi:DNA-binding transcriptional ArsR family regulator/ubiquinone/menaquinone biosynthesis C-methylase UbiE
MIETLLDPLVHVMKAVGEPTRLRILSVLRRRELSVSELCSLLDQSQPRVSRHLKLLTEAGLLERHAEGASAYFGLAAEGVGPRYLESLSAVLDDLAEQEPLLVRDSGRLEVIRQRRAASAAAYFEQIASEWDQIRARHVGDAVVERALLEAVGDMRVSSLIDIGTGTGRVLELFGPTIERGLGIDLSPKMLSLARSHLDEAGLSHCEVRQQSVYDLGGIPGSHEVAVLHHVLHFLDNPSVALCEAARVLTTDGILLIVDFAPHDGEGLGMNGAHVWHGFADREIESWCEQVDLAISSRTHFPADESAGEPLTVTLWVAGKRAPRGTASSTDLTEVA